MIRVKLLYLLLVCLLCLVVSCEGDIIKPTVYVPENAAFKPFINRELLMDDIGFYPGYHNGSIRSDQITFSWDDSTDEHFLCYKLYRDNNLLRTFTDREEVSFTDENLVQNTYYLYMITTLLNTGMNTFDTLTIKTASLMAPEMMYTIPESERVRLLWRDRSDIPGRFIIDKEGVFLAEIAELPYPDAGYYYDYYDTDVENLSAYNYTIYKAGEYDTTAVALMDAFVNYVMVPPILTQASQVLGNQEVQLTWTEMCSAEDQFKIYRRLQSEPDIAFTVVGTVNIPNQTTYVDTYNLEYNQTYVYGVTAVNNYGTTPDETALSNLMSVTLYEAVLAQIGSGTAVNGDTEAAPVNIWYRSIRSQSVYTVAEINAAGVEGPMLINLLAYYVTQIPGHPLPDFRIRMAQVWESDASDHNYAPLQQVYYAPSFMPVAGMWNILELDPPLLWNGVDNILVDTSFNLVPSYQPNGNQYIFPSNNGMRYVRSDTVDQTNETTLMTTDYKPQIIFGFITNDEYAGLGGQK